MTFRAQLNMTCIIKLFINTQLGTRYWDGKLWITRVEHAKRYPYTNDVLDKVNPRIPEGTRFKPEVEIV